MKTAHGTSGDRPVQRLHLSGRQDLAPHLTVAEANNCVVHLQQVLNAARQAKLHVFYAMHRRYRPGDYETWKYIAPIQKAAWRNKSFKYGTWGGEIRAEFARCVER
jgi:hypothetical protein